MRLTLLLTLSWSLWLGHATAATFDAVAEFSDVTATGRIWSYNYALDGVTAGQVPLPAYDFFDGDPTGKFSNGQKTFRWKVWRDPLTDSNIFNAFMTIGVNRSAFAWTTLDSRFVNIPAATIFMHPPVNGSVVLGFTAPRNMLGTVNYDFTHLACSGVGINFMVQQVRPAVYRSFVATIDSGTLPAGSCSAFATTGNKSAPVALLRGDQINFMVRPASTTDNQYDSTGLTASITTP